MNRMFSKHVNTKETFGLFYTLKYKCFFLQGILTFKTEVVMNLKELSLYILNYPANIHSKHKIFNVNTC